jgi:5-methylcytosine-specific restriction endonuclease McrA
MTKLIAARARLSAPTARLASTATAGSGFASNDGRSAAARGYDAAWRALRRDVLDATPICVLCRTRPATEVDHIVAFRGVHDPLRLARSNVRSTCTPCHRSRTARQSHGIA